MKYNPTDALRILKGVTRKRLYEMMNNGDISYSIDDNKRYIDGSELARVFGDKFSPNGNNETENNTEKKQNETQEIHIENRLLRQKVEALEERLKDKEAENARVWEKLSEEAEERRKLTALLTDQRLNRPEWPVERRKGFFATLLGKTN